MAGADSRYDLCIIGGGPGGLAALSSVLEPFSHDQLSADQAIRAATANSKRTRRVPKVCIIDPMPWLSTWRSRFQSLEIKWLRSPSVAHPDMFDMYSLFGFAERSGREDELVDTGAGDSKEVRAVHQVASGTWRLPSNALFEDFCQEIIKASPHDFHRGRAQDLREIDGGYAVDLDSGVQIQASSVVLALGVPGDPVMPAAVADLPRKVAFHTDAEGGACLDALAQGERVLVVGGGLSAVQAAQLAHRRGCEVLLVSRRPLTTRHFDIDVKWFDWRKTQHYLFEFLSLSVDERLGLVKKARGGGSVPKMYMEDLRARERQGKLTTIVGEIHVVGQQEGGAVEVQVGGSTYIVDKIVSACGHRPDCTALPLIANIQKRYPAPLHGGLPALSKDLQWLGLENVHVIGSLAALQIGPDAGNLMGLRRAAQIVASAVDSRSWLRDESSVLQNVRGNRFAALYDDSEDGSDSDETASECCEKVKCDGSSESSAKDACDTRICTDASSSHASLVSSSDDECSA